MSGYGQPWHGNGRPERGRGWGRRGRGRGRLPGNNRNGSQLNVENFDFISDEINPASRGRGRGRNRGRGHHNEIYSENTFFTSSPRFASSTPFWQHKWPPGIPNPAAPPWPGRGGLRPPLLQTPRRFISPPPIGGESSEQKPKPPPPLLKGPIARTSLSADGSELPKFTNLNKKQILQIVSSSSTKYDQAMRKLVREKRTQLSRELRNMYHSESNKDIVGELNNPVLEPDTVDRLNAIIPDLGVDLSNLPPQVVSEISSLLQVKLGEDDLPENQNELTKVEFDSLKTSPKQFGDDLVNPEQMFNQAQVILEGFNDILNTANQSNHNDEISSENLLEDENTPVIKNDVRMYLPTETPPNESNVFYDNNISDMEIDNEMLENNEYKIRPNDSFAQSDDDNIELPSNMDDLQLPSDVSNLFNFPEIMDSSQNVSSVVQISSNTEPYLKLNDRNDTSQNISQFQLPFSPERDFSMLNMSPIKKATRQENISVQVFSEQQSKIPLPPEMSNVSFLNTLPIEDVTQINLPPDNGQWQNVAKVPVTCIERNSSQEKISTERYDASPIIQPPVEQATTQQNAQDIVSPKKFDSSQKVSFTIKTPEPLVRVTDLDVTREDVFDKNKSYLKSNNNICDKSEVNIQVNKQNNKTTEKNVKESDSTLTSDACNAINSEISNENSTLNELQTHKTVQEQEDVVANSKQTKLTKNNKETVSKKVSNENNTEVSGRNSESVEMNSAKYNDEIKNKRNLDHKTPEKNISEKLKKDESQKKDDKRSVSRDSSLDKCDYKHKKEDKVRKDMYKVNEKSSGNQESSFDRREYRHRRDEKTKNDNYKDGRGSERNYASQDSFERHEHNQKKDYRHKDEKFSERNPVSRDSSLEKREHRHTKDDKFLRDERNLQNRVSSEEHNSMYKRWDDNIKSKFKASEKKHMYKDLSEDKHIAGNKKYESKEDKHRMKNESLSDRDIKMRKSSHSNSSANRSHIKYKKRFGSCPRRDLSKYHKSSHHDEYLKSSNHTRHAHDADKYKNTSHSNPGATQRNEQHMELIDESDRNKRTEHQTKTSHKNKRSKTPDCENFTSENLDEMSLDDLHEIRYQLMWASSRETSMERDTPPSADLEKRNNELLFKVNALIDKQILHKKSTSSSDSTSSSSSTSTSSDSSSDSEPNIPKLISRRIEEALRDKRDSKSRSPSDSIKEELTKLQDIRKTEVQSHISLKEKLSNMKMLKDRVKDKCLSKSSPKETSDIKQLPFKNELLVVRNNDRRVITVPLHSKTVDVKGDESNKQSVQVSSQIVRDVISCHINSSKSNKSVELEANENTSTDSNKKVHLKRSHLNLNTFDEIEIKKEPENTSDEIKTNTLSSDKLDESQKNNKNYTASIQSSSPLTNNSSVNNIVLDECSLEKNIGNIPQESANAVELDSNKLISETQNKDTPNAHSKKQIENEVESSANSKSDLSKELKTTSLVLNISEPLKNQQMCDSSSNLNQTHLESLTTNSKNAMIAKESISAAIVLNTSEPLKNQQVCDSGSNLNQTPLESLTNSKNAMIAKEPISATKIDHNITSDSNIKENVSHSNNDNNPLVIQTICTTKELNHSTITTITESVAAQISDTISVDKQLENQITEQLVIPQTSDTDTVLRKWRSPGEKKYICNDDPRNDKKVKQIVNNLTTLISDMKKDGREHVSEDKHTADSLFSSQAKIDICSDTLNNEKMTKDNSINDKNNQNKNNKESLVVFNTKNTSSIDENEVVTENPLDSVITTPETGGNKNEDVISKDTSNSILVTSETFNNRTDNSKNIQNVLLNAQNKSVSGDNLSTQPKNNNTCGIEITTSENVALESVRKEVSEKGTQCEADLVSQSVSQKESDSKKTSKSTYHKKSKSDSHKKHHSSRRDDNKKSKSKSVDRSENAAKENRSSMSLSLDRNYLKPKSKDEILMRMISIDFQISKLTDERFMLYKELDHFSNKGDTSVSSMIDSIRTSMQDLSRAESVISECDLTTKENYDKRLYTESETDSTEKIFSNIPQQSEKYKTKFSALIKENQRLESEPITKPQNTISKQEMDSLSSLMDSDSSNFGEKFSKSKDHRPSSSLSNQSQGKQRKVETKLKGAGIFSEIKKNGSHDTLKQKTPEKVKHEIQTQEKLVKQNKKIIEETRKEKQKQKLLEEKYVKTKDSVKKGRLSDQKNVSKENMDKNRNIQKEPEVDYPNDSEKQDVDVTKNVNTDLGNDKKRKKGQLKAEIEVKQTKRRKFLDTDKNESVDKKVNENIEKKSKLRKNVTLKYNSEGRNKNQLPKNNEEITNSEEGLKIVVKPLKVLLDSESSTDIEDFPGFSKIENLNKKNSDREQLNNSNVNKIIRKELTVVLPKMDECVSSLNVSNIIKTESMSSELKEPKLLNKDKDILNASENSKHSNVKKDKEDNMQSQNSKFVEECSEKQTSPEGLNTKTCVKSVTAVAENVTNVKIKEVEDFKENNNNPEKIEKLNENFKKESTPELKNLVEIKCKEPFVENVSKESEITQEKSTEFKECPEEIKSKQCTNGSLNNVSKTNMEPELEETSLSKRIFKSNQQVINETFHQPLSTMSDIVETSVKSTSQEVEQQKFDTLDNTEVSKDELIGLTDSELKSDRHRENKSDKSVKNVSKNKTHTKVKPEIRAKKSGNKIIEWDNEEKCTDKKINKKETVRKGRVRKTTESKESADSPENKIKESSDEDPVESKKNTKRSKHGKAPAPSKRATDRKKKTNYESDELNTDNSLNNSEPKSEKNTPLKTRKRKTNSSLIDAPKNTKKQRTFRTTRSNSTHSTASNGNSSLQQLNLKLDVTMNNPINIKPCFISLVRMDQYKKDNGKSDHHCFDKNNETSTSKSPERTNLHSETNEVLQEDNTCLQKDDSVADNKSLDVANVQEIKNTSKSIQQSNERDDESNCSTDFQMDILSDFVVIDEVMSEDESVDSSIKTNTTQKDITENADTSEMQIVETNENSACLFQYEDTGLQCNKHQGSVLQVKSLGNSLLAACEDGKVYKYCMKTGELLGRFVGHRAAVTCFAVIKGSPHGLEYEDLMFTGCLDATFRCCNVDTMRQVQQSIRLEHPIQCMDTAWGYIFLGTSTGLLYRYNIQHKQLSDEKREIANVALLVLKATREGSRRVLVVAPRACPVSIRDAMSGLLLRFVTPDPSPVIYTVLLAKGRVYCGTSVKLIVGYDFTNGKEIEKYTAGPGVVCLLAHNDLLFAGCYDGNVYVYNLKTNDMITKISGSGGMVLALDLKDDKMIVGYKNSVLKIWTIPTGLLCSDEMR